MEFYTSFAFLFRIIRAKSRFLLVLFQKRLMQMSVVLLSQTRYGCSNNSSMVHQLGLYHLCLDIYAMAKLFPIF